MLRRPRELAASFDRAADVYDARPGYPARVYELLASLAGLRPGARVLEIGPGVGQATVPLVEAGATVVAVEPGPALARRLAERVPGDRVEIVVSDFESAVLPEASFDLVVAATAFHWLEPAPAVAKAATLLRDGGRLALWWTLWGDDERPDPFHDALVPILRAKTPLLTGDDFSTTAYLRDIEARIAVVEESDAFGPVTRERIEWEGEHDPAGLRRMFSTFGAWISLPDELREELLTDVEEMARNRFAGVVRRPYQTVVYIAERRPRDVQRFDRATESAVRAACGAVVTEADPPWEPPLAGSEVEHLVGALERLRATFRWKADGLDAAQLQKRIGASTLTLGNLLKHLAFAEDYMFTEKLRGEPPNEPWNGAGGRPSGDWSFTSAADDPPDYLYSLWDGAVQRSRQRLRAALADGGLDQLVHVSSPDGEHASLRRLLCDLIEEYGRHTGHADLLREAVDGRVGEDPPPDWRPPG